MVSPGWMCTGSLAGMRLSDFILQEMETILKRWETFAASQLPASGRMTPLELRDDAQKILEAIAADLRTPQTTEAQQEKSMGRAVKPFGTPNTAAETHAVLRARSGFSIRQLAAEYRALRASVLHLWTQACAPNILHAEDITRFNEAVDQAVAESIDFYSAEVEQARNLLLGMVGHDMRTPLQTIEMTAKYLGLLNAGEEVSQAASRMIRSGARLQNLLNDLLDFNRLNLGMDMPLALERADLKKLFADQLEQLRAAYPDSTLLLESLGPTEGTWDGARLQRLLDNLAVNAIKYGHGAVRVVIGGDLQCVRFEVRNSGPPIDRETLTHIFNPLRRGQRNDGGDSSLGLGLYIAKRIAQAHGGDITAYSSSEETVFTVQLPRVCE
jgi:signal transduction histidine kinase